MNLQAYSKLGPRYRQSACGLQRQMQLDQIDCDRRRGRGLGVDDAELIGQAGEAGGSSCAVW